MDQRILDLKHATRQLPGGGLVLVLNTGAIIAPEAEAMLQALHSRSAEGIQAHLKVLAERGSEKFMSTFYVGYNHKSIGDCGTGTIFIEGVSMLVAKAVQDWMLYSGQETSTRYIDFSKQEFKDPFGTTESRMILDRWRSFYVMGQEPVREHLRKQFPRQENEKESVYEKAISARSFDILGAFLPAGASTNLAWHTNLRQAADKLAFLRHHPLEEVRILAEAIDSAVNEVFPSSFGHKRYEATEAYHAWWMKGKNYFFFDEWPDFKLTANRVDLDLLRTYREALVRRPEKTELPKRIGETGTLQFSFLLDFRSFRDIQRQRAVFQVMPLLTTTFGFEEWYLDELPPDIRAKAVELIDVQRNDIGGRPHLLAQYYIAMGFKTPNRVTGDLPALVYLAELRAGSTVHPTLQRRARQMAEVMENLFSEYGLKLYIDRSPTRFDVKRGLQDIVLKD